MDGDKAKVLNRLVRVVARFGTQTPLADRLCRACVEIVGVDGAAITLGFQLRERVTMSASDRFAARLEDLQEVCGEGPGWDAYRTRQVVSGDLENRDRWPMFSSSARRELGPARVHAVPMRPNHDPIGIFSAYQSGDSPSEIDITMAQFLADAVGAALLRDPEWDTGGPWTVRSRVHQATGMVIAQLGVNPDDAMALLRAHAYAHEASLDAIADAVISRRLDFSSNGTSSGSEET